MADYASLALAAVAVLWTIYQQYQINNMCYKCPFRQGTAPQK